MTAAELFEIVKDVPSAAKPMDMGYCTPLSGMEGWWTPEHDGESMAKVSPALAEAAFVGSMVAWLIGEGYHVHDWGSNSDTSTATLVLYGRDFSVSTDKYRGMGTIVALLAAACKEARP